MVTIDRVLHGEHHYIQCVTDGTFEYIFVVLFAVVFVWSCRHWYARGDDDIIGGAVGHSVGAVRAAGNSAVELVASAANAAPRNAFESMPIA